MRKLKPLIGICGDAGAGKDTLANGIAMIDVYFVYHFADPIKMALNAAFGWGMSQWSDREWKERSIDWLGHYDCNVSPRVLAQTLGTEWGREQIDEEIWLKIAQQKYAKIADTAQMEAGRIIGMGMIIPDVRFPNEAQWIRDEGGILFRVHRPGHDRIPDNSHSSEDGIPDELVSYEIMNEGPPSKMITRARELIWQAS